MKNARFLLLFAAFFVLGHSPSSAAALRDEGIPLLNEPVAVAYLFEIPEADIARFVAEYEEVSRTDGKTDGFINAILYQSLLPDHPYQLIAVEQWKSYAEWAKSQSNPATRPQAAGIKSTRGLYRPAAYYTHVYGQTEQLIPAKPADGTPPRVPRNPAIADPDAPFVFINLMEMEANDIEFFIADWKERSQLTARQPGTITATLYKGIEAGFCYPIMNVSQYQSYEAFIANQNDPTYSSDLNRDLQQTSSIKLVRGFFRPVVAYAHLYD